MKRILILEPDRVLAGSLSDYLSKAGYKVSVHSDPQAAITSADKHAPEIVIAELQLAGRSAIEFLYELRSYPEWQSIPVIVTGQLRAQEIESYSEVFRELNVSQYLYKPQAGPQALVQAIEHNLLLSVK
jgi:DNA-binding response OmpR family regulator